jgi:hypothetical protein
VIICSVASLFCSIYTRRKLHEKTYPLGRAEELWWDFVEIFINSFRRLKRNFRTNYSVYFMTM